MDRFSRTLPGVFCWVCGNHVTEFLAYGLPPRKGRCPQCRAKPRNRALLWYVRESLRPRLLAGTRILEIGASRFSARHVPVESVISRARYTLLDVRTLGFHRELGRPHGAVAGDVTAMPFADESVDVLLCNHTLPYVRDTASALGEIRRVLKGDGLAMLDSPQVPDVTRSAAEHRRLHPELDDAWFAENGDQWVFGGDYVERLAAAGFSVRVDTLFAGRDRAFRQRYGLKPRHELVVAFKSTLGARRFPPPP